MCTKFLDPVANYALSETETRSFQCTIHKVVKISIFSRQISVGKPQNNQLCATSACNRATNNSLSSFLSIGYFLRRRTKIVHNSVAFVVLPINQTRNTNKKERNRLWPEFNEHAHAHTHTHAHTRTHTLMGTKNKSNHCGSAFCVFGRKPCRQ